MTAAQAIEELRNLQTVRDIEKSHSAADYILCELLTSLGFGDVVDEYDKLDKWYA